MTKIIALGTYLGNRISVEAFEQNGAITLLVDGLQLKEVQTDFEQHMNHAPPMGGTFYPEPNTILAAFSVLESAFFEKLDSIEVQGELDEIPNEENYIY